MNPVFKARERSYQNMLFENMQINKGLKRSSNTVSATTRIIKMHISTFLILDP